MKKIFVSHSSEDKNIVDVFIDQILQLGLSFRPEDIAYTSREDTGVRTGDDIKAFIKDNISNCDFVIFMISNNYAESKICLNEMGAAWALDRNVIPIVLPDVGFDSIGWLYLANKAIRLNNSEELDGLLDTVRHKLDKNISTASWNRAKVNFLSVINDKLSASKSTDGIEIITPEVEELDLLDCREGFDSSLAENLESLKRMTESLRQHRDKVNLNVKRMSEINPNMPTQVRTVMQIAAYDNNKLSDIYDREAPLIKDSFDRMIYYAIKMHEMASLDEYTITEERKAMSQLIEESRNSLSINNNLIKTIKDDNNNLDKIYIKSRKRLIGSLSRMSDTFMSNINKGEEFISRI